MKLSQTVLEFDKTLWVHYGGGVEVEDMGSTLALTGKEEEAYLKVLNHFGRVMKLFTFSGGKWLDEETGLLPSTFDDSQAGRLPHAMNIPAHGNVKPVQAGKAEKKGNKAAQKAKPAKAAQAKAAKAKPAKAKAAQAKAAKAGKSAKAE